MSPLRPLRTVPRLVLLLLVPLVPVGLARHPHFPKRIEFSLGFSPEAPRLAVSHITVTFDRAGFEAMPVGGSWHLGGARFTTPVDLVAGGRAVAAGGYRLLARKVSENDWELVLDPGGRPFDPRVSEQGIALETRFEGGRERQEHLRIDLHPTGDRDHTTIHLLVEFDEYRASVVLELPEQGDAARGTDDEG